jgi:hypothetical protein
MGMYDGGNPVNVTTVHPSAQLSYSSGKGSTSRTFRMSCEFAEEFALRQLGKWWEDGVWETPELPAPFPVQEITAAGSQGRMNLVATGFSIKASTTCCFNNNAFRCNDPEECAYITDPASMSQLERYFWSEEAVVEVPALSNDECWCEVTIDYADNPCDCIWWNSNIGEKRWMVQDNILSGTCISTIRNPSYQLLTLPNSNLVWSELPDGPDRRVKHDTHAYQLIPQSDIVVSWHNVPVSQLCKILTHLSGFRNQVNLEEWGAYLACQVDSQESESGEINLCQNFEPETVLFVDYEEDRSQRTTAFGPINQAVGTADMNTTTLKLYFKEKTVLDPFDDKRYGWNHMFSDRSRPGTNVPVMMRVGIDKENGGGATQNLYPTKDFTNILNPTL